MTHIVISPYGKVCEYFITLVSDKQIGPFSRHSLWCFLLTVSFLHILLHFIHIIHLHFLLMGFIKIMTTSKRFDACITFMFYCLVNHFNILKNFQNLVSILAFNLFLQFNNVLSLLLKVCLPSCDFLSIFSFFPSSSSSSLYCLYSTSAIISVVSCSSFNLK